MQIIVTIALTVIYVGLSLALGGVHSNNGPWWFFLPCIVSACAFVAAKMIQDKLPLPWLNEQGYRSPPRRVHLSWRAAVRLPAYAPFLLILWHFLSILRMHFDIDGILYFVIVLVLLIMIIIARRRRREIRLLRSGDVAMAIYRESGKHCRVAGRPDLLSLRYHQRGNCPGSGVVYRI